MAAFESVVSGNSEFAFGPGAEKPRRKRITTTAT